MRAIKEQIDRMSAVSMRFAYTSDTNIDVFQGSVFDAVRMETAHADGQRLLWDNQFRFNQSFFDSLIEHSVPLDLRALKALRHSSRAIDVYCWLASRLYRIPRSRSTKIRWTSLRFQFGNPDQELDSFKRAFKEALKQVMVIYKEASSSVEVVRGGIRLKYAQPPVPLKTFNSVPAIPDKAF